MYKSKDKNIDEKIAFLKRTYVASLLVKSCKQHIQRLKDEQTQASSIITSGGGRHKWRAGKLEDVTALLMDYIDEYARCITAYLVIENEVHKAIDSLENDMHRYILIERYINFKSVSAIANAIHYSNSSVLRFHRDALRELKIKKPEAYASGFFSGSFSPRNIQMLF